MLVYNLVKERLYLNAYSFQEYSWSAKLGVVAFRKNHINVFLKVYNMDVEAKNIIDDTLKIRRQLVNNQEVNIWNSYMLIFLQEESDSYIDLVLNVEKDTTALRKYVICKESDINRIPFLDDTISEVVKPKSILESEYQGAKEIKELINLVQTLTLETGGKIPRNKLKEMLGNKVLRSDNHEDKKG